MNPAWFAGRLRELRLAKGMSREQLAKAAALSPNGIRDLEQGVRQPALPTLIALCQALGEPCDSLLAAPGDLPPPAAGRPRKVAVARDEQTAPQKAEPVGKPVKGKNRDKKRVRRQ
jgi:transcriptional regulator with XRE-family HTH domain